MGLHARTAAQLYDGEARWDAIAELKRAVTRIPVLGNGDIWEAEDALRMMRDDGLRRRRSWAAAASAGPGSSATSRTSSRGASPENPPDFGGVVDVMLEHARLLVALGGRGRARCVRSASTAPGTRRDSRGERPCASGSCRCGRAASSARCWPASTARSRSRPTPCACRAGKTAGTQKVALPEGYLDHLDDDTPPGVLAEVADSGG